MASVVGKFLIEAYKAEVEFYLKVIRKFNEILQMLNFTLWTCQESPDYQTVKKILSLYRYMNESLAYWMGFNLLITIIKPRQVGNNKVAGWFANWEDYRAACIKYNKLNKDEAWYDQFDDFFRWYAEFLPLTPQLKAASSFCDSAFDAMEWLSKHFYSGFVDKESNPRALYKDIRDSLERLAMMNLDLTPNKEGWYLIRPVWPLEWTVLKTHVKAETFYRDYFSKNLGGSLEILPVEGLPTEWKIGGNTLFEGTLGAERKDSFTVDKEFIEDNEGDVLEFDCKGMSKGFPIGIEWPEHLYLRTLGGTYRNVLDYDHKEWLSPKGWDGELRTGWDDVYGGCFGGNQYLDFNFLFKWIGQRLFIEGRTIETHGNDPQFLWDDEKLYEWPEEEEGCKLNPIGFFVEDGVPKNEVFVFDGDTFFLPGERAGYTGRITRLIGVDTPETSGENSPEEFDGVSKDILRKYGKIAKDEAKKILNSYDWKLVDDEKLGEYGIFNRRLRYVEFGTNDLQQHLLDRGLAREYSEAEYEKKELYQNAEQNAKENDKGLWEYA